MRINIGCGQELKEGYINIDTHKRHGADLVHNLPKISLRLKKGKYKLEVTGGPLPFKDGSVDEILCFHLLEDFNYEYLTILWDFYRVLKKGGILHLKVPYGLSTYNPNHIRQFDKFAFVSFKGESDLGHYESGNEPPFKLISLKVNRQNHLFGRMVARITSKQSIKEGLKGKGKDRFRNNHSFVTELYRFLLGLSFKKHEVEVMMIK